MKGFRTAVLLLGAMLVTPLLAETPQSTLSPQELDALFLDAEKAQRKGRFIEAMGMFEQAASQGHADAQNSYGYLLHKAGFYEQSFEMYRQAADQGQTDAMVRLGLQYADGEGVDADLAKARSLIEQAARAGNFYAYNAVYEGYKGGSLGYEVDPAQALHWLSEAADKGSQTHRRLLAGVYERGELGVEVDTDRALALYKQAAEGGDRPARNYLYRIYSEGLLGQAVDPLAAEQWKPQSH